MDVNQIGEHVKDAPDFQVPGILWDHLPRFLQGEQRGLIPLPDLGALFGWQIKLQLTRFMVLEAVAALLMVVIFVRLARKIATGRPPRGQLWNAFELVLVFLRDEVARPAIGRHDADRFLPFIWTMFFFILFCNLLGMVPWAGSPTGSIFVTAALASIAFCVVVASGTIQYGLLGYWLGLVPRMELPWPLFVPLWLMLLLIEVSGLCIKHCVLAVRLLANMYAGHLVLAVIVTFIAWTISQAFVLWLGVAIASVLSAVALSLLELFVAFLQAYVFTFLSALFIGMAVHQH